VQPAAVAVGSVEHREPSADELPDPFQADELDDLKVGQVDPAPVGRAAESVTLVDPAHLGQPPPFQVIAAVQLGEQELLVVGRRRVARQRGRAFDVDLAPPECRSSITARTAAKYPGGPTCWTQTNVMVRPQSGWV